jgi:hypothetical protein
VRQKKEKLVKEEKRPREKKEIDPWNTKLKKKQKLASRT